MPGPTDKQLAYAEAMLNELESLERQLDALREGLTRSHRLTTLGTIATIIAHEFNNILTPVISYCQLAQANPEDAALVAKALDRALNGSLKAAEISESMLGFSRDGNDGDDRPVTRLADAIDEAFRTLAREPAKDGITVTLDVPDDAAVAIGSTALTQIVLNLVLNARRAMLPRGGRLRVESWAGDDDQTRLVISDTGRGIPEDLREHIFQPFITRRDESADDDEPAGTGLGLAICRDLAQRAGGAIQLTDTSPAGTTFTVTLPTADLFGADDTGADAELDESDAA